MFIKDYGKTALIWQNKAISYTELIANVTQFSGLINGKSFTKAAVFAENRPEWVYAFYAAWGRDLTPVPIDYLSSADDVVHILNDCTPEIIFCSDKTIDLYNDIKSQLDHEITVFNLDALPQITPDSAKVTAGDLAAIGKNQEKTGVIIYTSGTTGKPKGVMLSFGNLISNINLVVNYVEIFNLKDQVLALLPFHHVMPLVGTVVVPLYVGAAIVFVPGLASADIINTLQQHKISIIVAVPRFYEMIMKGIKEKIGQSKIAGLLFKLAEKVDSAAFSRKVFGSVHKKFGGNIRFMVCGGAAIDPLVAKDFQTLGFEILTGFGMTEASPMITFTHPGKVRVGTNGFVHADNEIKFDENDQILVRGKNIMQGYYNRPEETAEILKDGWLYTGDKGRLDEDGFLYITGRIKEIIVLSNGKNINPVELEFKLQEIGGNLVKEVGVFMHFEQLSVVIYPDLAHIPGGITAAEEIIRAKVLETFNNSVAPYKKIYNLFVTENELPKTRLSKLKRFLLPEVAAGVVTVHKKKEDSQIAEYLLIKSYLSKQIKREVFYTDHLEMDLGLDSLEKISLLVFVNSAFGVQIKDEEMAQFTTLQSLTDYLITHKTKMEAEHVNWSDILKHKMHIKLPQTWFTQTILKNMAKWGLSLYFRMKAKGVENLPKQGPFIIAPNHQSYIDGLFITSFLKDSTMRKTYFYAKQKHVKNFFLKFMADTNNVIVMDMNKDLKLSLQKMAAVLKRGKNLIIFPEGTRSKDGSLGDFKKTFAILSRELNVPIVPVAINGAFKAMPTGSIFPRPFKKISVEFLKPVYPDDHSYETLKDKVFNLLNKKVKH